MRTRNGWLTMVLLLGAPPVLAQHAVTSQRPDSIPRASAKLGPAPEAARVIHELAPARNVSVDASALTDRLRLAPLRQRSRTGHAVLGGVIGAAAGIVVCTAISNYVNEGGFSTCTTTGYVVHAAVGFGIGALIGALIK
jgi:hypothetical protein